MSTIKSSAEDLTINADGSNEIKFQINAVEKASINSSGLLTSTTIDATALTGNLPAIDGSNLTGVGGASGTMLLSEKYYDEAAIIYASSTTWDDGNTVSFTKTESSSDSFIIYNWNGYLSDYANTGSDVEYRLEYTPSGGSATYATFQIFENDHTGNWRQNYPISLNILITTLDAGTHTFTMQVRWPVWVDNNNSRFESDAHQPILIREVLL